MITFCWILIADCRKSVYVKLFKYDLCAYEYTFRKLISSYIKSDVQLESYQSQNSVIDSLHLNAAWQLSAELSIAHWPAGASGLRMSVFFKRSQQQNWPHLMEAHGFRLLVKCLPGVNWAHMNSACPPATCCMICSASKAITWSILITSQVSGFRDTTQQNQHIKWRYNAFELEVIF